MKNLKRVLSLSLTAIIMSSFCVLNLNTLALNLPSDSNDVQYYYQDNFQYYIDSETSAPVITGIKDGTKVFNVPETIMCNGTTYPVKDLHIVWFPGYGQFNRTLESINVSKNIETISLDIGEYDDSIGYYKNALPVLKTINVPVGSQLKELFLAPCPKLENINFPKDSKLERICIIGCPELKKLSLPKTLKTCVIGSCPKLKKLSLPKNLKTCDIGYDAPKLKVKIAKGNKYLKVKGNQILSKDGKKLIGIVGNKSNVTAYKTVKVIGDDALDNKYLKQITLGQNVNKFTRNSLYMTKKIKIVLKHKNKAPKIKKYSLVGTYDTKVISFYVENKKVANDLKKKLKASGIEKAKILIGKKVVCRIFNY